MNRTTKDLINELEQEAIGAELAALVVGFEATTLYVFASDKNALQALDEMINSGGEPVGISRVTREDGERSLTVRPLQEYADDPHIRNYLTELMESFASQLNQNL